MTFIDASEKLKSCNQEHVLKFYQTLSCHEKKALVAQIEKIEPSEILRCAAKLKGKEQAGDRKSGKAAQVIVLSGKARENAEHVGENELKRGKVAVLLVAGGQGSRLGYEGPKGAFPIGPVSNKPIFYFHARKILALSKKFGKRIPWYIMTSEANDAATKKCFSENSFFGLNEEDVVFFPQGMWPCMSADGKILMSSKSSIFMSPDGHGGLLAALKKCGALVDMKRRGIKHVFFFQVDNPLVEIADSAFIGFHVLNKSEYSLKLCEKSNPYEKVGVPMKFKEGYRLVEYSEMTKEDCEKKSGKHLYYRYGSPAIHVFDRAFLEREADKNMPLHLAFKKIPFVDMSGRPITPKVPNGYKFEKFIFDLLPNAKKVAFLAFEKKDEFSPVKNAEGDDSPATCKRDMMSKWRKELYKYGIEMTENSVFEVDTAKFCFGGK